jgi:arylsulfatase A-like enzyme
MRRAALALAALLAGGAPRPPERLNVVLFLIDDLGWSDLGCAGSRLYETPNIDRLAAGGMTFAQAYSACTVCSPTRACLLTGKYPARLHITDWIEGHKRPKAKLRVPDWTMHLPHAEVTLAEKFKEAGYATAAIGKWHLGGPDFAPTTQGFDVNLGGTHRGQPPSYFSPYKIDTLSDGPEGEYLTDREAAEAVRFIGAHRDSPFFLYLPHHAVHTPLQAKAELIEKYRVRIREGMDHANAKYAAMIESVDASVGRVMAALEEHRLAERTMVLFTGDNGGLLPMTSNKPLRAGKGSAYEGGVRVPLLVRWPGSAAAGSRCEVPVFSGDLFATVLEAAGIKHDPVDGVSLVPLLRGTGGIAREALFWHYPHYHPGGATPHGAVRAGDWRLVEFYEDDRVELYNLKDDPGETRDRAAAEPERAAALRRRLAHWRASVGAQMPTPNPDYVPGEK